MASTYNSPLYLGEERSPMNFILGYARYLLLGGLALLGFGGFLLYQSATGGGIPQESALSVVQGEVAGARKVTVTKKRRRGGESKSYYYEVDVKPQTGDTLTVRLPTLVPESKVQDMANADSIAVSYDATSSHNDAYAVKGDGKDLLPYTQMAQYMQEDADRSSSEAPLMMAGGAVLALLGGAGMWWRRQRIQAANAVPA